MITSVHIVKGKYVKIILLGDDKRNKINNNLPKEKKIPKRQKCLPVRFEDELLENRCDSGWVTLIWDEKDFEKNGEGNLRLSHTIRKNECIYLIRGTENNTQYYIMPSVYWYIWSLAKAVKKGLDEGYLYDYMMADEIFDYRNEARARANPARYKNLNYNDYYLLRHALVYSYVYYSMFEMLFDKLSLSSMTKIHVLSFGCGAKTDAMGLRLAMYRHGFDPLDAKYVGIDPGAWNESEFFLWLNENDKYKRVSEPYIDNEINYINSNEFKDFFLSDDDNVIYLIVFPNSVSEFDPNTLKNTLLPSISHVFEGKRTFLCLSLNKEGIGGIQRNCIREFFPAGYFLKYDEMIEKDADWSSVSLSESELNDILEEGKYFEAHKEEIMKELLEEEQNQEESEDDIEILAGAYEKLIKDYDQQKKQLNEYKNEMIERLFGKMNLRNGFVGMYKELWNDLKTDNPTQQLDDWKNKTLRIHRDIEQEVRQKINEVMANDESALKFPMCKPEDYNRFEVYELK